ncbi:uncharacterized protein FSUBG_2909 [Fusarium subglutinans]|uniref:2EXR domain-containing protein n=1 Tax=Gibberella subglutinans TaxID=42677 RepID=A0A8H5Q9Q2_GIBSU|nr:uncharacterized protein FSUBG_2909 [Fusarium subglutinans]KAF5610648.1 hypothetical protein FSUBG_2909 [Fusarium subglutinans]
MSSATFHPFPRLPTELQLQIWKEACALSVIPGRDSFEQGGLHYVNVDTVKVGGRNRLALRVLDKIQDPNGDEQTPNNNRSAHMWDGGLWWACKLSSEFITEKTNSKWLRLPDYSQDCFGRPATLTSRNIDEGRGYKVFPRRDIFCIRTTDWKSLPQHFEDCETGLPSFDHLSSSIVLNCTLAIEFDSSWIVDLPETLEELKAENSARGLVATWMESVASGWVKTPRLCLIDKGTLFVTKGRNYANIYHDCDGEYVDMRFEWCNDAISTFIEALDNFLPYENYGDLYEKNNPNSWVEDLHMWNDFFVFQEIRVLARHKHADHEEVSWTAVCNDLSDDHERGSEKALSAYGRVYDLEYDDDVGYCVGSFGNSNNWFSFEIDGNGMDGERERVEYIKYLKLDLEKMETEVRDE